MSKEKKRGTFIHGISASEHLDSSGERIEIKGIDISSLTNDGVLNYEHKSTEASAIVGKITQAKKILKEEDCENEHHRYFWDKIKMPYLYVAGELFDTVGHQAAKDVAAMVRYDEQNDNEDTKKLINFSIEGSRLDRKGSLITKCVARKISITLTPCNKVCEAEELKVDENSEKSTKKADGGDFSFIQDIVSKGEHQSSCQIMKTNWGEMGAINTNIKSEKPMKKKIFAPGSQGNWKVGDSIDHKKPREKQDYGKVTVKEPSPKDTASQESAGKYGKVSWKSEHKEVDLKKDVGKKIAARGKEKNERYKRKQRVKRSPSKQAPISNPKRQPRADRQIIADSKKIIRKAEDLYHIHYQGQRLTEKPKSLKQIKENHGNIKDIEAKGHVLIPHVPKQPIKKSDKKKNKLSKYDTNVRKALTASAGLGSAPGAMTQGAALQKEADIDIVNLAEPKTKGSKKTKKINKSETAKIMVGLSNDAFDRFEKKEELLDFLSQKLPKLKKTEVLALAKTVAYYREKKIENKLSKLTKK